MPTPPTGTVRVTYEFTLPNSLGGNVVQHFWHRDGAEPTTVDMDGLLSSIADWFNNDDYGADTNLAMFKHLNEHTTLTLLRAQTLDSTPLGTTLSVGTAGTNTGLPLPSETAVVSTWRTGTLGRSYRGRSFWPGADPDMLASTGVLSSSQVTSWGTTLLAFLHKWHADPLWEFVVYSSHLNVITEVSDVTVQTILNHQRRRNT